MLRNEKDMVAKTQREYEIKIKELEVTRLKLEKDHLKEVESFKSEYARTFKDEDFDLHRRRLLLDEDEHKVHNERDRIARIQTRNNQLEGDAARIEDENRKFKEQNHEYHKKILETEKYNSLLQESLAKLTSEKENMMILNRQLRDQDDFLQQQYKDQKEANEVYKRDSQIIVDNLKEQLGHLRAMSDQSKDINERELRKYKDKHQIIVERERENHMLQIEKLNTEVKLLEKKYGDQNNFVKDLATLNSKLQAGYGALSTGGAGGLLMPLGEARVGGGTQGRTGSGKTTHNYFFGGLDHGTGDLNDMEGSEEILKRKKAWAELEREQDEIKKNIKSLMKTKPESRAMDDPIMAERVRGNSLNPQKYAYEETALEDKKTKALKEEMRVSEKRAQ